MASTSKANGLVGRMRNATVTLHDDNQSLTTVLLNHSISRVFFFFSFFRWLESRCFSEQKPWQFRRVAMPSIGFESSFLWDSSGLNSSLQLRFFFFPQEILKAFGMLKSVAVALEKDNQQGKVLFVQAFLFSAFSLMFTICGRINIELWGRTTQN